MKNLTLIASLALATTLGFGQTTSILEVVAPAGGFHTASNFSVSWTLGEPVIETWVNETAGIMVTSGFQQGSYSITSVPVDPTSGFNVKMYPNPAESFTNIGISLPAIAEVTVTVMDITGRTVMQDKFTPANQSHIHPLNISSLKSGLYIVSISSGNKLNKVLKLVVE